MKPNHASHDVRGFTGLLLMALLHGCHAGEVEPETVEAKSTIDSATEGGGLRITSPDGIFRVGAIEKLQRALERGGYEVTVTGEFDSATEQALLLFQGAKDLPRTGYPDHETIRLLGLDPQDLYQPSPTQP